MTSIKIRFTKEMAQSYDDSQKRRLAKRLKNCSTYITDRTEEAQNLLNEIEILSKKV